MSRLGHARRVQTAVPFFILSLLAVSLSGCLDSGTTSSDRQEGIDIRVAGDGTCASHSTFSDPCSLLPSGAVLLDGRLLDLHARPSVETVAISSREADLVVRDLSLGHASLVVSTGRCQDCDIELAGIEMGPAAGTINKARILVLGSLPWVDGAQEAKGGQRLILSDIDAHGEESVVDIRKIHDIEIRNLAIDCSASGSSDTTRALQVLFANTLRIEDTSIKACVGATAIFTEGVRHVDMSDVMLEDGQVGAHFQTLGPAPTITARSWSISNMSALGIHLPLGTMDIERSTFTNNGGGETHESCGGGAICTGWTYAQIHNSTIDGNTPYGWQAWASDSRADGRWNWWGDAFGPKVTPPTGDLQVPVGIGGGDTVNAYVLTVPFLDERP